MIPDAPRKPQSAGLEQCSRASATAKPLLARALEDGSAAGVTFAWDGEVALAGSDLWALVAATAVRLREHGIGSGDIVSLQIPNSPPAWTLHLATAALGAIVHPLPVSFGAHETAQALDSVRPTAFVTVTDGAAAAAEWTPERVETLTADELRTGLGSSESRLLPSAPATPDDVAELGRDLAAADATAPYLMLSTSGTSGPPKVIVHSQSSIAAAVDLTARALDVQPGEQFFCPAQPTHVTGVIFGLFMPLVNRSSCLFITRWDPSRAAELVDRYECTMSSAVPTFLIDLHEEWRIRGGSFLRRYCTGATDVPTDRIAEIERETGCIVVRGYGSTEAPMIACGDVHDTAEARLTRDGQVMPPGQVRVDDPDEDGVGELMVRGPQMALGYWENGRLAPITDADGWYRTADLGRVESGYVQVRGRIKDVIIRGGVKFYAPELDDLVASMPGVSEAATFAIADERLGQLPGVAVVLEPGAEAPTVEDVREHFERLSVAPQKCPVAVMVVNELPMTESRKLNRPELARLYAETSIRK